MASVDRRGGICFDRMDNFCAPVFHHVDFVTASAHVEDQIRDAYLTATGRKLNDYEVQSQIDQSPTARAITKSVEPHNRAHRVFNRVHTQLYRQEEELLKVVPLRDTDPIVEECVDTLMDSIAILGPQANTCWAAVLDTNRALDPHFQVEHVRPGAPLAEGAGSE